MKTVQKSVWVPYTPAQMFGLVSDVPSYPTFLPWCQQARVLKNTAQGVEACLNLCFWGLHCTLVTDNTHILPEALFMRLVQGPFSNLEGAWHFKPLGPADAMQGCRVDFNLHYQFSNALLAATVGKAFDMVANSLVDAFVQRAKALYGQPMV